MIAGFDGSQYPRHVRHTASIPRAGPPGDRNERDGGQLTVAGVGCRQGRSCLLRPDTAGVWPAASNAPMPPPGRSTCADRLCDFSHLLPMSRKLLTHAEAASLVHGMHGVQGI